MVTASNLSNSDETAQPVILRSWNKSSARRAKERRDRRFPMQRIERFITRLCPDNWFSAFASTHAQSTFWFAKQRTYQRWGSVSFPGCHKEIPPAETQHESCAIERCSKHWHVKTLWRFLYTPILFRERFRTSSAVWVVASADASVLMNCSLPHYHLTQFHRLGQNSMVKEMLTGFPMQKWHSSKGLRRKQPPPGLLRSHQAFPPQSLTLGVHQITCFTAQMCTTMPNYVQISSGLPSSDSSHSSSRRTPIPSFQRIIAKAHHHTGGVRSLIWGTSCCHAERDRLRCLRIGLEHLHLCNPEVSWKRKHLATLKTAVCMSLYGAEYWKWSKSWSIRFWNGCPIALTSTPDLRTDTGRQWISWCIDVPDLQMLNNWTHTSLQPSRLFDPSMPVPWCTLVHWGSGSAYLACLLASSDPESHPKVGFESVSGFGFRVSSIEINFRCRFRVSGFGFRCLKPTFAVGFGFRVSSIETHFRCRFRVSGFGFRSSKPTYSRFRVSVFGFRSALGKLSLQSRFRVSGFGFRSVLGKVSLQSRFRVSGFGFRSVLEKLSLQSRFRVSGFAVWNQL